MNNEGIYKTNSRIFKNYTKLTREFIAKENETAQLTLRKERMDYLLASKRKIPQIEETQDYRIKVKELNLPSEYEINLNKYYENFNLAFLKNYFYSSNIILQKYALPILLNYLSGNDSNEGHINFISSQLDSEFLSVLCKFLIIQDKAFQYESCWVITNLVYNDCSNQLLCDNEDNLKNIMLFFINSINDSILLSMALWLIRNLTAGDIRAQNYFLKEKLLELFPISLSKYPFEEKIQELMILIVNNLSTSKSFLNEFSLQFLEIIPLLAHKITYTTPIQLLRRVIFCTYQISYITESIDIFINHALHLKIMETITELRKNTTISKTDKEYDQKMNYIVIYCLKIIGNLVGNNNVQTQRLINDNILDFLDYYLKDSSYIILHNTLWAISNIASGTVGQIIQLYKKNILLQIIHIGIEVYKEIHLCDKNDKQIIFDVFKEVIYVICFCIHGSLHDSLLPWLAYSNSVVIVFLCDGLKIYMSNYELIKYIIEALTKVIMIEKDSDLEMNDGNYINTLISNNIEENIKRLQSCCNSEICNLADNLSNTLFN